MASRSELRVARIFLWWGILVTCAIGLIQGAGGLRPWSLITLAVLGAVAATTAVLEHGLHKASTNLKRWFIPVLIGIWGGMGSLGYFVWAHSESTPTRESLQIEGLPGFFGFAVIKLTDAPSTQRQYIADMQDLQGAWASLYISASNLFTFSITDTHGEVYPLEVALNKEGISLDKWIYIQCEAGISGGKTIMAVSINGRIVGSRIVQSALDLGDRNWGKGGGTFGGNRQHQQFGTFSISEFGVNSSTWTSEEQEQGDKYIEQKYAIKLSSMKN